MNACVHCGAPAIIQMRQFWRCQECHWKWLDDVRKGLVPLPDQSEVLAWARLVTHKSAALDTPEDLAQWLVQLGLAIRYDRGDMRDEAIR